MPQLLPEDLALKILLGPTEILATSRPNGLCMAEQGKNVVPFAAGVIGHCIVRELSSELCNQGALLFIAQSANGKRKKYDSKSFCNAWIYIDVECIKCTCGP